MTSPGGDAPLFRRRAFEADWVASLQDRYPALAGLLRLEARSWIVIGEQLGYFHDCDAREGDRLGATGGVAADIDVASFARALDAALDDLTPQRAEFLELVFMAAEDVWSARLDELRAIEHDVLNGHASRIEPMRVDRISWALEGAESAIAGHALRFPARWRGADLDVLRSFSDSADRRLAQLGELQSRIQDAVAADWDGGAVARGTVPDGAELTDLGVAAGIDVIAESVGIVVLGERVSVVLVAGTPIPATATMSFAPADKDQTRVEVVVAVGEEGEPPWRTLASLTLSEVPERGYTIDVSFHVDTTANLHVSVTDPRTGLPIQLEGGQLGTSKAEFTEGWPDSEARFGVTSLEDAPGRRPKPSGDEP